MIGKKLIFTYDEKTDMMYVRIDEKSGYILSLELCRGVYLNINRNNELVSIEVEDASEIFDSSHSSLADGDKRICILSTEDFVSFKFFLNNKSLLEKVVSNEFRLMDTVLVLE